MRNQPDQDKDNVRESGRDQRSASASAYPLTGAPACQIVQVVQTSGGRRHRAKLAAMGVLPGSRLKVCCNLGGPLIVEAKGSRLSLGRGMAARVMVKSIGSIEECQCAEQDMVCRTDGKNGK